MNGLATGGVAWLIYLGFVLKFAGFAARDELALRLLVLVGTLLTVVYYYVVTGAPLWDAVLTNGMIAAVNAAMILIVLKERTTWGMTVDTVDIYRHFTMLTPGQFRRLLKAGLRREVHDRLRLLREGDSVNRLYFVTDGPVTIERDGRSVEIDAGVFLGEIAYLTGGRASATVTLGPGARYLSWGHETLDRLFDRSRALKVAVIAQLNLDLAAKLSNSAPVARI